jgi:heptosyltransferase-2
MPDPSRIVILSPNWLGDAVMALPAISDVKRKFPAARLIVAARQSVADVFRLAPPVDDVLVLQWNGRLFRTRDLRNDLTALRALDAEGAILFPNSFASAWLVSQAGIRKRFGYARDWRQRWLTRAITVPKGSVHQAEYYQHLVRSCDVPSGPLQPILHVPVSAIDEARARLVAHGWDQARPLVAVAPGAAYGTAKRWLPAHFGQFVTMLVREQGATVALVGSGGDRDTTGWVRSLVAESERSQVIDLAGETTIATLAGVMSVARVFVSNDSGAMHMASALAVPVVALFGPTREYETAPLSRDGVRVEVLLHPVWCRPCMLRECPIDHRCMRGLTPERVFEVVRGMMEGANRP